MPYRQLPSQRGLASQKQIQGSASIVKEPLRREAQDQRVSIHVSEAQLKPDQQPPMNVNFKIGKIHFYFKVSKHCSIVVKRSICYSSLQKDRHEI